MGQFDAVKMGLCKVIVDPSAVAPDAPFTIDKTKGGVKLKIETKMKDVTIDQTGDTPIKKIKTGIDASIEVPIAVSDLETLALAFPDATKVTNATTSEVGYIVSAGAGTDMLNFAKPVRIEPIGGTPDDYVTFFRAIPEAKISQAYELEGVRVVNVVFTGVPDPDNSYRTVMFGNGLTV